MSKKDRIIDSKEMDSILSKKEIDIKDLDTRLNAMYVLAGCIEYLKKDIDTLMPPEDFKMKNRETFKRLGFLGQELRLKISQQIEKESGKEESENYKDTIQEIKEFIITFLKRVNTPEDMLMIHSTVKNYFKEK